MRDVQEVLQVNRLDCILFKIYTLIKHIFFPKSCELKTDVTAL